MPSARTRSNAPASAELWPASPRGEVLTNVAGVLALVAGLLVIASAFPDYGSDYNPDSDLTELLGFLIAAGTGIMAAGVMLIFGRQRVAIAGSVAAAALALLFLSQPINAMFNEIDDSSTPAAGFWLQIIGFGLLIVAAVVAALSRLRPLMHRDEWRLEGRARLVSVVAFFSFATAVGYGMNPIADRDGAYGSPLDPYFPRAFWSQIIVVVALALLPVLAATSRRWGVTAGITVAYLTFVLAWNLDNLLYVYVDAHHEKAIEGTWTFLAAGSGTVLLLLWCLTRPRSSSPPRRGTRRSPPRLGSVGALFTLLAAVVMFSSMFPSLFDRFSPVTNSSPAFAIFVLSVGFAIAGALMLGSRTRVVGIGILTVSLVTVLGGPVFNVVLAAEGAGPATGVGFWLYEVAYLVAIVGLVLALMDARGAHRIEALGSTSARWVLGALALGIATVVAFAMNYLTDYRGSYGSALFAGDPYGESPNPRMFWAVLVTIVTIPALAVLALRASRNVALGIFIGLGIFVMLEALIRLSDTFAFGQSHGAEGTWTFVAAGPALMLLLGVYGWRSREQLAG